MINGVLMMDIPHAGPTNFYSLPWYRKLLIILLFPFVVPYILLVGVLLGGLVLFGSTHYYICEHIFKRRMRRCGRFISVREAKRRMNSVNGTLIIESPSPGWGITRAWWTPDKMLSVSPYKIPTHDDFRAALKAHTSTDWDQWCFDHYVGSESGKAFLLKIWNGKKLESRLKAQFPDMDIVTTWSALSHLPKAAPS